SSRRCNSIFFFFSSRRRHTRFSRDWSSDVCSSDLCLSEAVENFAVEEFIAKLRVEALAIAVLPRASWLDERSLCADGHDPFAHCLGNELRTVVRTNMARHTPHYEQIGQDVDDVG